MTAESSHKRLDALIQCARALAFTYGGTREPSADEPEALAQWKAMHATYDALGVTDTRDLKVCPHGTAVTLEECLSWHTMAGRYAALGDALAVLFCALVPKRLRGWLRGRIS